MLMGKYFTVRHEEEYSLRKKDCPTEPLVCYAEDEWDTGFHTFLLLL